MAHGEFLRHASNDPELASHVMHDYRNANLDTQTRAMLDYATKLTREPTSMQQSDVIALRETGLTDEQILSVVLITCNFNFMTRLADGLGVEVPKERQKYVETWLDSPARDQNWLMKAKALGRQNQSPAAALAVGSSTASQSGISSLSVGSRTKMFSAPAKLVTIEIHSATL